MNIRKNPTQYQVKE